MNFQSNTKQTIALVEKFDVSNAERLLLSDHLPADGKRILRKYLGHLESGQVEVTYTNDELGRMSSKMTKLKPTQSSATQVRLWNDMKAAGCKGIYTDVDMSCAHPNYLASIYIYCGDNVGGNNFCYR